jgi:hypothetical protein
VSDSGVEHGRCPFQFPNGLDWREFYNSALLELDPVKLPTRIADAEQVLIQRTRELFEKPGDHIEEEQALDDAMYALQGLRSACKRSLNMSQFLPGSFGQMRSGTW